MQFEARDQTSVTTIGFAQRSTFTTVTRNLGKTAIVGSHKAKNRTDRRTRKRWYQQRIFAAPIWSGCYTHVVKAKIEYQGNAHQVEFAHVFVLIFVYCLEPETMRKREIAIVPLH